MNDSQRSLVFWLLIVAAPFAYVYAGTVASADTAIFASTLAALACVGGAFLIRAGRSKK
jgi:hypothetical protein